MSNTIFLPPIQPADKTIYVSVKNTSSEQNIHLQQELIAALQANGWTIESDYTKAHDMVQVNILQVGKAKDPDSVMSSLSNGFGGALAGGLIGGAVTGTTTGAVVGGAALGTASWLGGMLVKDVTYSMITDIQVSAAVPKGTNVTNVTHAAISQGRETTQEQTYSSESNMMTYRTRIASYADKANLDFAEAEPVISKQMVKEIANIF